MNCCPEEGNASTLSQSHLGVFVLISYLRKSTDKSKAERAKEDAAVLRNIFWELLPGRGSSIVTGCSTYQFTGLVTEKDFALLCMAVP